MDESIIRLIIEVLESLRPPASDKLGTLITNLMISILQDHLPKSPTDKRPKK